MINKKGNALFLYAIINNMKKTVITVLMVLSMFCLCSCQGKDGDLYTKKEVINKVKDKIAERHEFDHVESFMDEVPKREIYYFKSKERDLTFTVLSTLNEVWIDSPTGLYQKYIRIDYDDAIRELYKDEIESILSPYKGEKGLVYKSFDELKGISDALCKADDVYVRELQYNSEKWLEINPYATVSMNFMDEEGNLTHICSFRIDGGYDEERTYSHLANSHITAIKDGRINDDSVPAELLEKGSLSNLKYIYINDVNYSQYVMDAAKKDDLHNRVNEYDYESGRYGAYYYSDYDEYVIQLDCAVTDETYAPQYLKNLFELLNIDGEIKYKKGQVSWKYEGDSYEIKAAEDKDGGIEDFRIYKNGEDLSLDYTQYRETNSPINATYLVGIRLSDFEEIFNLRSEVDENEKILYLYSN